LWLAASTAEAVSPRAYVSVNGNDANTCNVPTTPCRTFTGAISQTTSGGEVVVLDSGTFGGGTISQSVTINAPAGVAALAATAIIVNAGASDVVTLRGITFVSPSPGSGTALTFSGGAGLNVENCVFHGWQYGIYVSAPGEIYVTNTTVRDSSARGIHLQAASGVIQASLANVQLLDNILGLYVSSNAKAGIKDAVVAGNGIGLNALAGGTGDSELAIETCALSNNSIGAYATSSAGGVGNLWISGSSVTGNTTGLLQGSSGVILSRTNNTIEGNGTDTSGTIGAYAAK
jgi:hypothetical protein